MSILAQKPGALFRLLTEAVEHSRSPPRGHTMKKPAVKKQQGKKLEQKQLVTVAPVELKHVVGGVFCVTPWD